MDGRPLASVHGASPAFVIWFALSNATHETPGSMRSADLPAHLARVEETHGAGDVDHELGAAPARDLHPARVRPLRLRLANDLPGAFLHVVRGLPFGEREGLARGEVEAELPPLGPEPEAVFAAVVVELRPRLARLDERAMHEAEAASSRGDGARHHAPLIRRRKGDSTAAPVREHVNVAMLGEESDVVLESHARPRCGRRGLRASRRTARRPEGARERSNPRPQSSRSSHAPHLRTSYSSGTSARRSENDRRNWSGGQSWNALSSSFPCTIAIERTPAARPATMSMW